MSRRLIMGKKAMGYRMADYVLSGGHERDELLRQLRDQEIGTGRKDMRVIAYGHIYHAAYSTLHGYKAAQREVTELIKETLEDL